MLFCYFNPTQMLGISAFFVAILLSLFSPRCLLFLLFCYFAIFLSPICLLFLQFCYYMSHPDACYFCFFFMLFAISFSPRCLLFLQFLLFCYFSFTQMLAIPLFCYFAIFIFCQKFAISAIILLFVFYTQMLTISAI